MVKPLPKSLANVLSEMRRVWRDFIDLFAIEGRLAALRLVRLTILAVFGSTLIILAWIFMCLVGAQTLHEKLAWEWRNILLVLAGIHLIASCFAIIALRNMSSQFFFPATLEQLRGKNDVQQQIPQIGIQEMELDRDTIELSLEQAKSNAAHAVSQSQRELKEQLSSPSMLAGAVVVGFLLAPRRSKNGAPSSKMHNVLGFLLPIALNQLTSYAVATVTTLKNNKRRQ